MTRRILFLLGLLHALGISLAGDEPPDEFDDEEPADADARVVHVLCYDKTNQVVSLTDLARIF